MRPEDQQAIAALDGGRAVVQLSDGDTWDEVHGCKVYLHPIGPEPAQIISLEVLIRHFFQTQPQGAA